MVKIHTHILILQNKAARQWTARIQLRYRVWTELSGRQTRVDVAVTDITSEWALALPSYSDQVMPFNVTLAGANEYGAMCASKILGIEILNEGSGISVDDAVTESQATFVARAIEPLQAVNSPLDQVSPYCLDNQASRAQAGGPTIPGSRAQSAQRCPRFFSWG